MRLPLRTVLNADELNDAERRAQRLLQVGALLLCLACLQALLRYALMEQPLAALLQVYGLAVSGLSMWLLRRGRVRPAAMVFLLGAASLILPSAIWLDVPSPGTPRCVHLYLLPLLLLSDSVLATHARWRRWSVQIGLLLLFLVLAALPPLPTDLLQLSEAQRATGGMLILGVVVGMLIVLIHLHDSAWLAQGELELALARAIADRRLSLALQPQCDAQGSLLGAEALVRWQDKQRGWVSPAVFVPLAERSGLVLALGEQVLEQALAVLQQWQRQPQLAGRPLAVNLSALQLQDDAHLQRLLSRVAAARLPRGLLKFELTESVLIAEPERMHRLLERCRAQGIATALDDFGTGYASLATLRQLPFDQLKIDQRFVRQLPGNPRSQKVARTLIELGAQLGMSVIAEGVETAEHVQLLQAMGCAQFQGYHFARPMTATDFETWSASVPPLEDALPALGS